MIIKGSFEPHPRFTRTKQRKLNSLISLKKVKMLIFGGVGILAAGGIGYWIYAMLRKKSGSTTTRKADSVAAVGELESSFDR